MSVQEEPFWKKTLQRVTSDSDKEGNTADERLIQSQKVSPLHKDIPIDERKFKSNEGSGQDKIQEDDLERESKEAEHQHLSPGQEEEKAENSKESSFVEKPGHDSEDEVNRRIISKEELEEMQRKSESDFSKHVTPDNSIVEQIKHDVLYANLPENSDEKEGKKVKFRSIPSDERKSETDRFPTFEDNKDIEAADEEINDRELQDQSNEYDQDCVHEEYGRPEEDDEEIEQYGDNFEGAHDESEDEPSNFGYYRDVQNNPPQNVPYEPEVNEEEKANNKPNNENKNEDEESNQSFGREKLIQHISVSNQDQDILDFKHAFDLKYSSFKRSVLENYQKIRFDYLKQMDFAIRENERDNNSAIDYLLQQIDEASVEKDAAMKRASQSRLILANILREKYNTFFIKREFFQAWKYYHDWKHYEEAKSKFWDNYYKKRSLQTLFNHWRKITHDEFVEKIFMEKEEYDLMEKSKLLYLSQLQARIEEETGLVLQIPQEYLTSIGNGLDRIKVETVNLKNSHLFDEVNMTQTERIFIS